MLENQHFDRAALTAPAPVAPPHLTPHNRRDQARLVVARHLDVFQRQVAAQSRTSITDCLLVSFRLDSAPKPHNRTLRKQVSGWRKPAPRILLLAVPASAVTRGTSHADAPPRPACPFARPLKVWCDQPPTDQP